MKFSNVMIIVAASVACNVFQLEAVDIPAIRQRIAKEGKKVEQQMMRHKGKLITAGALLATLLATAAIKRARESGEEKPTQEEKLTQVVIAARKRANEVFHANGITYESKVQRARLLNWGAAAMGGIDVLKDFLEGDKVQTILFMEWLKYPPFRNSLGALLPEGQSIDELMAAFPERGVQLEM